MNELAAGFLDKLRIKTASVGLTPVEGFVNKLPYNTENERLLRIVLDKVISCIDKSDWINLPSAIDDLSELEGLKIRPESDYYILLIQLFYNLILGPSNDRPCPQLCRQIATLLTTILKKNKKSLCGKLVLDYRLLLEHIDQVLFPPPRAIVMMPEFDSISAFSKLAIKSKRYFVPEAASELLDLLLIDFEMAKPDNAARSISLLALLIPSKCDALDRIEMLLSPSSSAWLINSSLVECLLMGMTSRIVKHHPKKRFGSLGFYYGLLVKNLKLPEPAATEEKLDRKFYEHQSALRIVTNQFPSTIQSLAKFHIYSLLNEPESIQELERFFNGLDSYFHPSNSGRFSENLGQFLTGLSATMARAISKMPANASDNLDLRASFVKALWPAAEKMSFSKSPLTVLGTASAIKHLAFINPCDTIPKILDTTALTLTLLAEPHRTLSSISVLARTARLQLELYRDGQESGLFEQLLELTVGLDFNDPFKTAATLNLFASIFTCLPQSQHFKDELVGPSDEYFERFVSSFLERSFSYIDNASHHSNDNARIGALEATIYEAFGHVWSVLFAGLPKVLWQFAIEKVRRYFEEPKGSGSLILVNKLAEASKGMFAQELANTLLSKLFERLKTQLACGIGQDVSASAGSCINVLWDLSIATGLLKDSQGSFGQFIDAILDIIPFFLKLRQEDCVDWAVELLRISVKGSCLHYPTFIAGWTEDYTYPNRLGIAASPIPANGIDMSWYLPTAENIQLATRIVDTLLANVEDKYASSFLDSSMIKCLVKFKLLLGKCFVFLKRPITETLAYFIAVAEDPTQSVDVRSMALQSVDELLDHATDYLSDATNVSRRSAQTWLMQLQNYPKQKDLPPLLQSMRLHNVHQKYQTLLHRLLETDIVDIARPIVPRLCKLALGSFSSLRIPAQSAILRILQNDAQALYELINELVESADAKKDDEASIKGLIHFLRKDQVIRFFSIDLEHYDKIISLVLRVMNSRGDIPELLGLCSKLLSECSTKVTPICQEETLLIKFSKKYEALSLDGKESWKAQMMALVFTSFLHYADRQKILRQANIFLNSIVSENAEIRSLAVNRGIGILAGEKESLRLDLDSNLDSDLDSNSDLTISASLLQVFIARYLTLSNDHTKTEKLKTNFRVDCAELFWSLSERLASNEEMFIKVLDDGFELVQDKTSIAYYRAVCEAYAGAIRGFLVKKSPFSKIVNSFVRLAAVIRKAGIETGGILYEAGQFIGRSISEESSLVDSIIKMLYNDWNTLSADSIAISNWLRFCSGLLKFNHVLSELFVTSTIQGSAIPWSRLFDSPSDAVRTSTVKLLLGNVSTSKVLQKILDEEETNCNRNGDGGFIIPITRCKSILFLTERMTLCALQSNFWGLFPKILPKICHCICSADLIVQKHAEQVLKVMSWTNFLSFDESFKDIALSLFETLNDSRFQIMSVKKALLIFLRNFYSRNFIAGRLMGETIADKMMPFVSDPNIEIRQESSLVYAVLFHCDHKLAADWARKLQLRLSNSSSPASTEELYGLVLIASALIKAFPYAVPLWMPKLLTIQSRFINFKYPIQETIRNLFSEFKRTHGDTWEQDREKFTEDELDAISELLVAPSYYA